MATATAPAQRLSGASRPGFGATLASEWTKLRSLRSTWIIFFLAITLSIGFSALMAFVTGVTFDDWGPNEQAAYDPLINSTAGILFGIILLIVFGVLTVTSEYSSKMIRTTFIATPQRVKVLAAKAVIVGVLGIIISAIITSGMILVSQAIFGSYGLETASLGDSEAVRLLVVYSIVPGLIYTLIPFSIAFLLRGTASAITASIGLFFLPFMLSALLPTWVQENVFRYFADIAMDSLAGLTSSDSTMHLNDGPAIAVIIAWLAAGLVLASVTLKRRDA
jgi:ABC-2 type transport system permease protein